MAAAVRSEAEDERPSPAASNPTLSVTFFAANSSILGPEAVSPVANPVANLATGSIRGSRPGASPLGFVQVMGTGRVTACLHPIVGIIGNRSLDEDRIVFSEFVPIEACLKSNGAGLSSP